MDRELKKLSAIILAMIIMCQEFAGMTSFLVLADVISAETVSENVVNELNETEIVLVKNQKKSDALFETFEGYMTADDRKIVGLKRGTLTGKKEGVVRLRISDKSYVIKVYEPGFTLKKYKGTVGEVLVPAFDAKGLPVEFRIPAKYADMAVVNESGQIELKKKGTIKIAAVVHDLEYTAKVKVYEPRLSSVDISVGIGEKYRLKLIDAAQSVVWSSSNEEIASVKKGRIKGVGRGSCVVTALCGGKEYATSVYVSECALTTKILTLGVGESKRVGIKGIETPLFREEWSIKGRDNGIISLSADGTVTGLKNGNARICVKAAGKSRIIKVKVSGEGDTQHKHKYKIIDQGKAQKCVSEVERHYECECKSAYIERAEAGHDYEVLESRENSCVEAGYEVLHCKRCDLTLKKEIDLSEYPLAEHIYTHVSDNGDVWECSVCKGRFVRNSDGSFTELNIPIYNDPADNSSSDTEDDSVPDTDDNEDILPPEKEAGSSSEKDTGSSSAKDTGSSSVKDTGSSSAKDTGSSSAKDTGSSSAKDTGSSSAKDTGSSSVKDTESSSEKNTGSSSEKEAGSSSQEHVHQVVSEKYIDEYGSGYITGYECTVCKKRWYQDDGEQEFVKIEYNYNYPESADMVSNAVSQRAMEGRAAAITSKKAGINSVNGYYFAGWSEKRDALAAQYTPQDTIYTKKDLKLYAVWLYQKYKIDYIDELSAENENVNEYIMTDGYIELKPLIKKGYSFEGFYDEAGNRITAINSMERCNRVIEVRWSIIEYSINYTANIPDVVMPQNPDSYTVETESFALLQPEKTGYDFIGFRLSDSDEALVKDLVIRKGSTGSREYIAVFEPTRYSILYVLNEGENSEKNPLKYTIEEGVEFEAPVRKDYSFEGWYTTYDFQENSRIERIDAGGYGKRIIYAKWRFNEFDYLAEDTRAVYDGRRHTVSFECSDKDVKVDYSSDGVNYINEKPEYIDAGEYSTYIRLQKDNYKTLIVEKKVMISKAEGRIKRAPKAVSLVYSGEVISLLEAGSSSDGVIKYHVGDNSAGIYETEIPTAINAGNYQVWYYLQGDLNHYDSAKEVINIVIQKAPGEVEKAPRSRRLTYNGADQLLVDEGIAKTGEMEYALATEEGAVGAYSKNIPIAREAGKYYVYYRAAESANYNKSAAMYVEADIKKAVSSVKIMPAANKQSYTKGLLTLVSAGTADGGKMLYGIGTENAEPAVYSESLPSGINAGEYYVYYKVAGDDNHEDSPARYIKAEIDKADGHIYVLPAALSTTYSGYLQTVINAGKSETGTMKYKVSGQNTYSTELPKVLNAGTYTIYYYSEGDSNHYSTPVYSMNITMDKAVLRYEFESLESEYDGREHYPTVKVTSDAKLTQGEVLWLGYCTYGTGAWCFVTNNDGGAYRINESKSTSIPFYWQLKKDADSRYPALGFKERGSYTFNVCGLVYSTYTDEKIVPSKNFKTTYGESTVVIK